MVNSTNMQRQIVDASEVQHLGLETAKNICIETFGKSVLYESTKPIYNDTLKSWFCPAFWDDILCWPITTAKTVATIKCPIYVVGFDKPMNYATRPCMENGTWFIHQELQKYWTNYSECFGSDQATVLMDLTEDVSKINGSLSAVPTKNIYANVSSLIPWDNPRIYLPLLKTIPRIGYTVSLCTLLVAFTIMFSIKRLHCPRNNLHMNLFASFIFRAFILLLKDLIFVEGVGLTSNVKYKDGLTFFYEDRESNNWSCKLVTSLWEFLITANYSWILMEGLYLHNLIFRALFTDSNSNITHYIVLGWGLPILVIIPWIITRIMVEDTYCWTTHNDLKKTFLIIQIPTTISILINVVLFIRIAKVLFSKLRSSQSEEARRYQKWAKSTLVLVPLFGIHYAIFLGMWYYQGDNEVIEVTWLIFDQLFASFQGFFVAILYCFLNGEVRTELKPYLHSLFSFLGNGLCCKCYDDDFRTIRSRSSVCTMMSSTSLYNGVNHHHRHKARWDCLQHPKHPTCQDKNKEHICRPGVQSWHDISPRRSSRLNVGQYSPVSSMRHHQQPYYSNGSIPQVGTTTCLDCQNEQERCKSEPHLGMEMTSMLPNEH